MFACIACLVCRPERLSMASTTGETATRESSTFSRQISISCVFSTASLMVSASVMQAWTSAAGGKSLATKPTPFSAMVVHILNVASFFFCIAMRYSMELTRSNSAISAASSSSVARGKPMARCFSNSARSASAASSAEALSVSAALISASNSSAMSLSIETPPFTLAKRPSMICWASSSSSRPSPSPSSRSSGMTLSALPASVAIGSARSIMAEIMAKAGAPFARIWLIFLAWIAAAPAVPMMVAMSLMTPPSLSGSLASSSLVMLSRICSKAAS